MSQNLTNCLKKWKEYYKQFEDDSSFKWLKDEFVEAHFKRWYSLRNITKCYYDEIDVR